MVTVNKANAPSLPAADAIYCGAFLSQRSQSQGPQLADTRRNPQQLTSQKLLESFTVADKLAKMRTRM